MSRVFHATCALGLEAVLAGELGALGAQHVHPGKGGVRFHGTMATGYAACLWVRSASRVSEQLFRDRPAGTREQLYDAVRGFDWGQNLPPSMSFAIHASSAGSYQRDARFLALVAKDAIVDRQRDRHGERSSIDSKDPDVPMRLVVQRNRATLLRDLSGDSLHRRGWRPIQHKSPLNEAIAAGLLLRAGWTGEGALLDPTCGSGTFLIEAAHIAMDRAPGLRRSFAFERWPDLDTKAWSQLQNKAKERFAVGRQREVQIAGADSHAGSVAMARQAAVDAEVAHAVTIRKRPLDRHEPLVRPTLVVANPPWGLRLGADDHEQTWHDLGQFLKEHCGGAHAWLLSGSPELTKPLRMRADERVPIRIAQVDARFIHYTVRDRDEIL